MTQNPFEPQILAFCCKYCAYAAGDLAGSMRLNPNVAKAGGLQSQGAKGEAVVDYCEPLATWDLEPSGFPEG